MHYYLSNIKVSYVPDTVQPNFILFLTVMDSMKNVTIHVKKEKEKRS